MPAADLVGVVGAVGCDICPAVLLREPSCCCSSSQFLASGKPQWEVRRSSRLQRAGAVAAGAVGTPAGGRGELERGQRRARAAAARRRGQGRCRQRLALLRHQQVRGPLRLARKWGLAQCWGAPSHTPSCQRDKKGTALCPQCRSQLLDARQGSNGLSEPLLGPGGGAPAAAAAAFVTGESRRVTRDFASLRVFARPAKGRMTIDAAGEASKRWCLRVRASVRLLLACRCGTGARRAEPGPASAGRQPGAGPGRRRRQPRRLPGQLAEPSGGGGGGGGRAAERRRGGGAEGGAAGAARRVAHAEHCGARRRRAPPPGARIGGAGSPAGARAVASWAGTQKRAPHRSPPPGARRCTPWRAACA